MMGVRGFPPTVDERDHPGAGHPRRFTAVAMPNGDARFGVEGQLVLLIEERGAALARIKLLSRGEARRLRVALDAAERAFEAGEEFDRERPTAYTGPFPDHSVPTMADHAFHAAVPSKEGERDHVG